LQKIEFKFPLILKINTSSGSKKEKLFVDKITSTFKIKQNEKPVSIIVDPDTELLMSKMIKEK
jgi:hypothetical protein